MIRHSQDGSCSKCIHMEVQANFKDRKYFTKYLNKSYMKIISWTPWHLLEGGKKRRSPSRGDHLLSCLLLIKNPCWKSNSAIKWRRRILSWWPSHLRSSRLLLWTAGSPSNRSAYSAEARRNQNGHWFLWFRCCWKERRERKSRLDPNRISHTQTTVFGLYHAGRLRWGQQAKRVTESQTPEPCWYFHNITGPSDGLSDTKTWCDTDTSDCQKWIRLRWRHKISFQWADESKNNYFGHINIFGLIRSTNM